MDQETLQKMSFETALARLEEIVGALECGTAALDDSLALFEEGVALVRLCNGKLDSAQQRIQIAHYGYYRLGLTRALRTVVDRQKRIDHFVYVAAVLRQKELASRIVVIFFHYELLEH